MQAMRAVPGVLSAHRKEEKQTEDHAWPNTTRDKPNWAMRRSLALCPGLMKGGSAQALGPKHMRERVSATALCLEKSTYL
ncbi:hypothetical protein NDU88_000495 [Pleurodeles waltl]|uniref:Uncharacterized protein n=1 Tax=Pleurodeles waltl TaxID=8319 RepID=A0AAV7SWU7_PLEWA|nr:hypothetical protein NDU88_000495 [Pleurodeles waltl]